MGEHLEHLAGLNSRERTALKLGFLLMADRLGTEWVAAHYEPMKVLRSENTYLQAIVDGCAAECPEDDYLSVNERVVLLADQMRRFRYERDLLALNCSLGDKPITIAMGPRDREVSGVELRSDRCVGDGVVIEPREAVEAAEGETR